MDRTFICIGHIDLHFLKSQMKSWRSTCGLFEPTRAQRPSALPCRQNSLTLLLTPLWFTVNLLMWKPFPGPSRRFGGVPPQQRFVNTTVIDFFFFLKSHDLSSSIQSEWVIAVLRWHSECRGHPKTYHTLHVAWPDGLWLWTWIFLSSRTKQGKKKNHVLEITRPYFKWLDEKYVGSAAVVHNRSRSNEYLSEDVGAKVLPYGAALFLSQHNLSSIKVCLKMHWDQERRRTLSPGPHGLKIQHVCEGAWKEDASALFLIHLQA